VVNFSCNNCGQQIKAPDKLCGRRVKCPKCSSILVVPQEQAKIRFNCRSCGKKISVPETHAGKKGKCPKCKSLVVVPRTTGSSVTADRHTSDVKISPKNADWDALLSDTPQKREVPAETTEQDSTYEDLYGLGQTVEQRLRAEQDEHTGERKLPWLIDIFLYPLNLAGVIHLICLWLLVFLLCPLVMEFLGLGIEYTPIVYTLPVAYVLYYFAECIRDSAAGGCRAPDFWKRPNEDKWDCILQSLVVLGCIAVCFCPASVYYIVTKRTDLIYWLLLACGGFFFPMVLLAVVLFDSYNALNPILIIGSIFRTFLPYCGMVLLFYGGALLFMKIGSRYWFRLLPAVPFIFRVVQLYLVFVAVGLLGRFHWKYREKLNWEV